MYRVDLAIEQQRGVVSKPFESLSLVLHGAAPIPYIQEAILNLFNPYTISTTVPLDVRKGRAEK